MTRTLATLATLVLVALAAAGGPLDAQAPRPLQITLLGTGNPRPNLERFGPSILVEASGQRLLIDAGRGAAQRLFQIGQRDTLAGLDAVLLTHLHSDHTVGLPDVWLTPWISGRARALPLIGPAGTADMARHLAQAYAWDIATRQKDEGFPAEGVRLDGRDAAPGVVWDRGGVKVTAFPVDHGAFATPAFGYRVDANGRSVVVSGDMRFDETFVGHARGADVVITEVISPEVEARRAQVRDPKALERILARHISPEQAGTLFSRITPRLAVFTHVVPSPATAEDLLPPARTTYSGLLAAGYDLMTIVVGDTIETFPRRTLSDQ